MTIDQLEEFQNSTVSFVVNGQRITCPKFVEVNGSLEPGSYIIQEGDDIETRGFYTVGQLAEFMDVVIDKNHEIIVNNRVGDLNTLVYENFSVEWTEGVFVPTTETSYESEEEDIEEDGAEEYVPYRPDTPLTQEAAGEIQKQSYGSIHLTANGNPITLSGQKDYIFSDIFRVIDFDTGAGGGRTVVTTINGNRCGYADPIKDGDTVDIRWE